MRIEIPQFAMLNISFADRPKVI